MKKIIPKKPEGNGKKLPAAILLAIMVFAVIGTANALVYCPAPRPNLIEISSDTVGTLGNTDTVSITARAVNANGMTISSYGRAGILQLVGRTQNNQVIKVTYKCVSAGTFVPLKLQLVKNGRVVKEIAKQVHCMGGGILVKKKY